MKKTIAKGMMIQYLLIFMAIALSAAPVHAWRLGSWSGIREIQTDLTITRNSLGTSTADGLILQNTTAAVAGAQQISPRVRWTGQGWKTNATAGSQQVDYVAQLVPVQGAAAPQARLDFNYSINGGALQATPTMSLLNGSAGFGTINPTYQVQLSKSSPDTDPLGFSAGSPWLIFENTDLTANNYSGLGFFMLDSNSASRAGSAVVGIFTDHTAATVSAELAFQIRNSGTILEAMRINKAANIGFSQTTFGTNAAKVMSFGGPATAPTTRPADVFTFYPFDVNGAGTMGLAWMSEDNGIGILGSRNGFGTITPDQFAELEQLETITGAVTDGYAAALRLDPGYTAATALTVTRHNYIEVQNVSVAGAGPAAVTDAALFRFDAAIATHKALVAGFNTTDSGAHTTAWAGGIVINVSGTLYKIPIIAY